MKKWLIVVVVIFFIILWKAGHLAYSLFEQKHQLQAEGAALAKQYTAIAIVDAVSLYNGKDSYIVVQGKSAENVPMIAWFKDQQYVSYVNKRDIVDKTAILKKVKEKAPGASTMRIQPGMDGKQPIWEAIFKDQEGKFNYFYYNMNTGAFIRSYKLQQTEA